MGLFPWQEKCAPFAIAFLLLGFFLLRVARMEENCQTQNAKEKIGRGRDRYEKDEPGRGVQLESALENNNQANLIKECGRKKGGSGKSGRGKDAHSDNAQGKLEYWIKSGLPYAFALAAAAALSSGYARGMAARLAGTIYRLLILPLLELALSFLLYILRFMSRFFKPLAGSFNKLESFRTEAEINLPSAYTNDTLSGGPLPFARLLGYIILAFLAAALIIYLFKRLSGNASALRKTRADVAVMKGGTLSAPASAPGKGVFTKGRGVCYYYRRLLKLCDENRLMPAAPVTTQGVHDMAKTRMREEPLAEFKDLYREARYGRLDEDAAVRRQAARLFREIRGSLNHKEAGNGI